MTDTLKTEARRYRLGKAMESNGHGTPELGILKEVLLEQTRTNRLLARLVELQEAVAEDSAFMRGLGEGIAGIAPSSQEGVATAPEEDEGPPLTLSDMPFFKDEVGRFWIRDEAVEGGRRRPNSQEAALLATIKPRGVKHRG